MASISMDAAVWHGLSDPRRNRYRSAAVELIGLRHHPFIHG
jgi:hypothetical protein